MLVAEIIVAVIAALWFLEWLFCEGLLKLETWRRRRRDWPRARSRRRR